MAGAINLFDPNGLRVAYRVRPQETAGELAQQLWGDRSQHPASLGEILPGLEGIPNNPAEAPELSTRARNCLTRNGIVSWHALAVVDPPRLRHIPNLGVKLFTEIVDVTLMYWERGASDLEVSRIADESRIGEVSAPPVSQSDALSDCMRPLLLAAWIEAGASTLAEAFDCWSDKSSPKGVTEAYERARNQRLAKVLGIEPLCEEDWEGVLGFPAAELAVLDKRVLMAPTEKRTTYDMLGDELGLSRERVRQIQDKGVRVLTERLASPAGNKLRHEAARVVREVGDAFTSKEWDRAVRKAVKASSRKGTKKKVIKRRRELLRYLAGPFGTVDNLMLSEFGQSVLDELAIEITNRDQGPFIPPPVVDRVAELSRDRKATRQLLMDHLRLRAISGGYVLWNGTQADKAEVVLAARGEPMSMFDIHEAVGFEVNPRSLAGRIQGDQRFMRRGKDRYGLRRWGGEEYSGITEELEQAIERAGGEVDFEETVATFVSEFGVSESSVRSYAAGRGFALEGGMLRNRSADEPLANRRHSPIELSPDAFKLGGVWCFRIELDHDVVRGSGRPIRAAIATKAGLEPDLTFGVDVEGSTIVFSWGGNQPTLGSVGPLIRHHGCEVGDLLFLPLEGEEPRSVHVVRAINRESETGARRFALEIGLDPDDVDFDEHPLSVSEVFGLPAGADWHDIVDRLRERRSSLIDWLPERLR